MGRMRIRPYSRATALSLAVWPSLLDSMKMCSSIRRRSKRSYVRSAFPRIGVTRHQRRIWVTGGGEWLSSLRARATITVATEGWQPNVAVAAARLSPLGIPVVYTEGATDNHRQEPGDPAGRLPFRTDAFDLVTNRHESFRATEVARVLRREGTFLTQQTHSGSQQFHELLGSEPPGVQELELDMIVVQLQDAGLSIDEAEIGTATTLFADIGALAWYLRSVPWAVPGFTVSTYRQALLRLHNGPIRVPHRRFWLRAHK
jgi:hypothetical protein